ncbi:hypothetical protein BGY98DRAFT_1099778 [Russula aff. rugulosa BPL654]|nr:hypothetical protein BGY98DRAFT_1099778 [Russula aff. rugulosa BPL654]
MIRVTDNILGLCHYLSLSRPSRRHSSFIWGNFYPHSQRGAGTISIVVGQGHTILREALPTRPQEASLALAGALLTRFVFETHATDDCEEGIAVLDKFVASIPPEDNADQYRVQAAEMIALLALARSIIYSDPGNSEEAILRCRIALSFSSLDDQLRVVLTQALAIHAEQRFKYFGLINGLQEAITLVPEIVNLLSSGEGVGGLYTSKRAYSIDTVVEKIEHLEGLLLGTTSGSLCHRTYIEDLACGMTPSFPEQAIYQISRRQ